MHKSASCLDRKTVKSLTPELSSAFHQSAFPFFSKASSHHTIPVLRRMYDDWYKLTRVVVGRSFFFRVPTWRISSWTFFLRKNFWSLKINWYFSNSFNNFSLISKISISKFLELLFYNQIFIGLKMWEFFKDLLKCLRKISWNLIQVVIRLKHDRLLQTSWIH